MDRPLLIIARRPLHPNVCFGYYCSSMWSTCLEGSSSTDLTHVPSSQSWDFSLINLSQAASEVQLRHIQAWGWEACSAVTLYTLARRDTSSALQQEDPFRAKPLREALMDLLLGEV